MNKFIVTYTDGTKLEGDAFNGDWKKVDDTKQITKLEYVLGNCSAMMQGFKQYNHFKERLGGQVQGYSNVVLMGRTNGNTLLIIFDLLKNQIHKVEKAYGNEYGRQILNGWQDGLLTTAQAFINGQKIY